MKNLFKKKNVKLKAKAKKINSSSNGIGKSQNKFLSKLKRKKSTTNRVDTPASPSVNPDTDTSNHQSNQPSLGSHGFVYEEDTANSSIPSMETASLQNDAAPLPLSKPKNNNLIKILALVGVLLLAALLLVAYLMPGLLGMGGEVVVDEDTTVATVPVDAATDNDTVPDGGMVESDTDADNETATEVMDNGVVLNENPEADPEVQAAIEAALNESAENTTTDSAGAPQVATVDQEVLTSEPVSNTSSNTDSNNSNLSYQDFLEASEQPILIDDTPAQNGAVAADDAAPTETPTEVLQ